MFKKIRRKFAERKLKKNFLKKHEMYLVNKCPKTKIDLEWVVEFRVDRIRELNEVTEIITPIIICKTRSMLYYYIYNSEEKKSYMVIKGSQNGMCMNDPSGFTPLWQIFKYISPKAQYIVPKKQDDQLTYRYVLR